MSTALLMSLAALAGGQPPSRADSAGPAIAHLRVCADPNNLPFSDHREAGFDNRIASVLARRLHADLSYTWQPERRGFLRETLLAHRCDVAFGVPSEDPRLLTTRPYYQSSYVFVQRPGSEPPVHSLADPRLRQYRIGIHVIGDDYNSLPPGVALVQRGLVSRVSGYSIYGDYSRPSPPRALIDAVARRQVDLAIAWGPLAGYFADATALKVTPVPADEGVGAARLQYAISIGVRPGDSLLCRVLNHALELDRAEIDSILVEYHVPLSGVAQALATRGSQ
jgi:quinoprotein dehydrogenase-associated probable ABC transporter substrate-binding protein